jgi:hypothetical protein
MRRVSAAFRSLHRQWKLTTPPVERAETNFQQRLNDILLKPFIMLALEPMLLAVTLYMSFVYGLVYLLFEAFPFVFVINVSGRRRAGNVAGGMTDPRSTALRNWKTVSRSLPFSSAARSASWCEWTARPRTLIGLVC